MFNAATNGKHRTLIEQVLKDVPGSSAADFPKAIAALQKSLGMTDALPTFRPDAYRINHETQEIELYEVEVRHALPQRKIEDLGDFWFAWDAEGEHDWLPVLIVVGRYGGHQRIDLAHAYYRTGPLAR